MKKLIALLTFAIATQVGAATIPIVANSVVEEQVVSGTEKVYSLAIKQGEGVAISVAPTLNSGSISYYLYDNEQLRSYSYLQSGSASTTSHGTLDFKAAVAGTYYLHVKSTGSGSYKLGVYNAWFNNGASDAERTFHGSPYSAWELKNGTYSASAATKVWYRFNASAGTKIQIDVTPVLNTGAFGATIYDGVPDSSGRWTSLANIYSYSATNGVAKTLTFTPATSGNFYLETYQGSGGTLTLSATGITLGTYQPPAASTTTTATCPTSDQQAATSYAGGVLKIPEVQVSDGLGGTLKYAVDLEIVPLSDPVLFKIKAATQKK